jgi:hypothetical protein
MPPVIEASRLRSSLASWNRHGTVNEMTYAIDFDEGNIPAVRALLII